MHSISIEEWSVMVSGYL